MKAPTLKVNLSWHLEKKEWSTPSTIRTTPPNYDPSLWRSSRVKRDIDPNDSDLSEESEEAPSKGKYVDHSRCRHDEGVCKCISKNWKKKTDKKLVFLSLWVYEKAKEHQ